MIKILAREEKPRVRVWLEDQYTINCEIDGKVTQFDSDKHGVNSAVSWLMGHGLSEEEAQGSLDII